MYETICSLSDSIKRKERLVQSFLSSIVVKLCKVHNLRKCLIFFFFWYSKKKVGERFSYE